MAFPEDSKSRLPAAYKRIRGEPRSPRKGTPPTETTPLVVLVVFGKISSPPPNFWPETKVIAPVLLIERPVSVSEPSGPPVP